MHFVSELLPPEGFKILLVLFLSFLVGLEREEHKSDGRYSFGGVRTFPLIGLIGYAMALLSKDQMLPLALGFVAVAGFLMLSYRHKLEAPGTSGVTTEMSGLAIYLVGALIYRDQFWIATTLSVASMLLLELKGFLEGLTTKVAPVEVLTFTKFLVLTVVVLPVLPNQEFGPFHINPFKTWLVVVAVSGVSYGSYVVNRLTQGKGGIIVAAILGGAYSSTVTTVVMARRAKRELRPHLFSGGTLVASGMMYLRLAILLALFNRGLLAQLGPFFVVLGCLAVAAGWLWSRRPDASAGEVKREFVPGNPLELRAAAFFAVLFLIMLTATHLVAQHLGSAGVYGLAGVMGLADVDPFIMGMTQSAGTATSLLVASAAIAIAAASNNIVKGVYAYSLSDRKTGIQSLGLLLGLALAGLAPLVWLLR
ncbi:MAG: MgtC/SapB family protein [Bryobacteraceae bacterium]